MTTRKQNFIYAYDEETHQIIVIDAETGERIKEKDDRVVPILRHFQDHGEESTLRRFAIWCARECNPHIKPIQKKFLEMAEKAVQQDATNPTRLKEIYDESESEAVATDTVGLQQGAPEAPGFLASRECVNPDAFEGARNAARFHCLWAELNRDKEEKITEGLKEVIPGSSESAIELAEQAQVDYLLDLMGGD